MSHLNYLFKVLILSFTLAFFLYVNPGGLKMLDNSLLRQRLLCRLVFAHWSEHSCASWRMRWRGGKKGPKTEYSSRCNRFNLFCQNRLRYFASPLECCISLLPPSRLFPLLQYGTLHFIVSPGSEAAALSCLCLYPGAHLPGGGIWSFIMDKTLRYAHVATSTYSG